MWNKMCPCLARRIHHCMSQVNGVVNRSSELTEYQQTMVSDLAWITRYSRVTRSAHRSETETRKNTYICISPIIRYTPNRSKQVPLTIPTSPRMPINPFHSKAPNDPEGITEPLSLPSVMEKKTTGTIRWYNSGSHAQSIRRLGYLPTMHSPMTCEK